MNENISTIQLTRYYDIDTISKWINELNIFYFYQSKGGIGDDNGQSFKTSIKYTDKEDLLDKLKQLKIDIQTIPEDAPKPIKGQAYTSTEYALFKTGIKRFPDIEQPKNCELFGQKCFVYVFNDFIELSVSGHGSEQQVKSWLVSDKDFKVCKTLEQEICKLKLASDIDREVEKDKRYISKTFYKEQLKKEHNTVYSKQGKSWLQKLFGN